MCLFLGFLYPRNSILTDSCRKQTQPSSFRGAGIEAQELPLVPRSRPGCWVIWQQPQRSVQLVCLLGSLSLSASLSTIPLRSRVGRRRRRGGTQWEMTREIPLALSLRRMESDWGWPLLPWVLLFVGPLFWRAVPVRFILPTQGPPMLTSCGGGEHTRILEATWVVLQEGPRGRWQSGRGGGSKLCWGAGGALVRNLSFSVWIFVSCVYFVETYLLIYHTCACKIRFLQKQCSCCAGENTEGL